MDIKPILSSLRRSPTGAILVALQIALALAIVVNSLFIIVQRFEKVNRDPGMDVHTGQVCVLGGAPKPVAQPQKILLAVSRWAWTSNPITASYSTFFLLRLLKGT